MLTVNAEIFQRGKQHAGIGFAIGMIGVAIVLNRGVGVKRAEVKCVDVGAVRREIALHLVVKTMHRSFVVIAAPDACLVGDDDCEAAVFIDEPYSFAGPRKPNQILWFVGVAAIDV